MVLVACRRLRKLHARGAAAAAVVVVVGGGGGVAAVVVVVDVAVLGGDVSCVGGGVVSTSARFAKEVGAAVDVLPLSLLARECSTASDDTRGATKAKSRT